MREIVSYPRHYVLTRTLNRKNAKRRLVGWFYTKQACIDYAIEHYTLNCRYDIYTYKWDHVQEVDVLKYLRKEKKDEAEHR